MSGHSTYQPQNKFLQWFEKRLPLGGLIHSSFVAYPTPRNLNYLWTFGGILAFMLGVQIVTAGAGPSGMWSGSSRTSVTISVLPEE